MEFFHLAAHQIRVALSHHRSTFCSAKHNVLPDCRVVLEEKRQVGVEGTEGIIIQPADFLIPLVSPGVGRLKGGISRKQGAEWP